LQRFHLAHGNDVLVDVHGSEGARLSTAAANIVVACAVAGHCNEMRVDNTFRCEPDTLIVAVEPEEHNRQPTPRGIAAPPFVGSPGSCQHTTELSSTTPARAAALAAAAPAPVVVAARLHNHGPASATLLVVTPRAQS
jgi:hypothetical protein